ncbi:MAG: 1-(5-phosphoribosyl)-5-[(5-phosphoribosylamino)methylideneamino]imidazole-4-carboxamide isomerase [Syntrophales bacterium]|nr:1-(5-phosphoribosyl)-5-[(5-phosphoribosylamino)methylideneamino]imidazole-4-carboxamide isomerase [Syntrophales bacterium]
MIVIPAIDIKDGRCVRLKQGDFAHVTVYSEDPVGVAIHWVEKGAERLHVVDLDGSLQGLPVNKDVIKRIVKAVKVPVQVGGGIRNLDIIDEYIGSGVRWVILGSAALQNMDFVREACSCFPGRIILGVDARDGYVAISGWKEVTGITPLELVKRFERFAVAAVIYTDILRDGMRTGVNVEATRALAQATNLPIIASGGVSGLEDIEHLLPLERDGVIGVITGKALYAGDLDLKEAIKMAKQFKG